MSRPYKVKIRESIQETVIKDDSVNSKVEVLPILPPEGMENISRTILKEHGFEDTEDGKMCRERNEIKVTIDPKSGDVEARSEAKSNVNLSDEEDLDQGGCPCSVRNKETVVESMRKRLARKAEGIHNSVQEMVTGRLSRSLSDIACEMEQISNQITGRALKRKAQELGEIKKISHNDKTGEITIVVEV